MSQISQNIQNINREETKETFAPNRDVPGSKANFDEKKEFFEHLKDTDENDEFGGSSVGNEQGNFERQSGSIESQGNLKTGTPGGSNLMSNVPSGTSVSKDSSCTKDTTCPKDSKCDTSESKLSTSSNIPNPPPQPELNDKGEIKNTNTYGQGISNNIPPGTSLNEKKDTNLDTSDWTGSNQQFGRDLSGEQDLYKKGEWNKGELSAGKHWNEDNQPSSDKKLNERDSSSDKNWDKKESFEKNLSKRESGKDWDKKESSDENWGNRESSSGKDLNERDSSSDKNWNERESGKDWGNKDFSSSDKGFSGSESFNKDK